MFNNTDIAYAQEQQNAYGIPASVCLAAAGLESGWGTSSLARKTNNCFGITGKGPAGSYQGSRHKWRKYNNKRESYMDFGRLLGTSRLYASARAKLPNIDAFINTYSSIYAPASDGNSGYAGKIKRLINQYNLSQYNSGFVVTTGTDIITIAQGELGHNGAENGSNRYNQHGQAWCAFFACWCGARAGYAGSATPPEKTGSVVAVRSWFISKGRFKKRDEYTPQRNDYVIYLNNDASHVGIVESFDGKVLQTIEGNYFHSRHPAGVVGNRKITVGSRGGRRNPSWAEIVGWGCVHDYITSATTTTSGGTYYTDVPDNKSSMDVSTRTVDFDCATVQVILWPMLTGVQLKIDQQEDGSTSSSVEVTDKNGWMQYRPMIYWRKSSETEAESMLWDDTAFQPAGEDMARAWYIYLDDLEPDTEYTYSVDMYWKSAYTADFQLGSIPRQTFTFKTRAEDPEENIIKLEMELYPAGETKFASAGLGGLPDAISAKVSETINGEYELEVEYPASGANFERIKIGRIITARPQPSKNIDAFRIADIKQDIDGVATITCQHVSYDFSYTECATFGADSLSNAIYKIKHRASAVNANIPCRLRIDNISGKDPAIGYKLDKVQSLRKTFYEVLDEAGYEVEWTRWHAWIHEKRGIKTDYTIDYGYNLKNCDLTVDFSEYYTAVNTIYTTTDSMTISNGTDADGKEQTSSFSQSSAMFGTEVDKTSESYFPYKRLYLLDVSSSFSDNSKAPTIEAMDQLRDAWIDAHGLNVPKITLEASAIDLTDTYNYAAQGGYRLNIGDGVIVNCMDLGFKVKARVIKTVYDVINQRYETITIGNADGTLASTLSEPTASDLSKRMTAEKAKNLADQYSAEKMRQDLANKLAERNGLYQTVEDDGNGGKIYYLHDQPLLQDSKIVWKMTRDAFGVSTDGGKTWNAGLTVDGNLIAKILTTEGVNADWIRAGTIIDRAGQNYWNLDTGEVHLTAEAPDDTIEKIENEFYLSDSDATQTGGSWTASQPEWTAGHYIWTRVKYTHKDESTTYGDPVLMRSLNGAYENAENLSEKQQEALKAATTQQAIFDTLTNYGATEGLYLSDGHLYINGSYIDVGTITTDQIHLGGDMTVYTTKNGTEAGGRFGYGTGLSGDTETKGMHMVDQSGMGEVIVSTEGSRISYGKNAESRFYTTKNFCGADRSNSHLRITDNGAKLAYWTDENNPISQIYVSPLYASMVRGRNSITIGDSEGLYGTRVAGAFYATGGAEITGGEAVRSSWKVLDANNGDKLLAKVDKDSADINIPLNVNGAGSTANGPHVIVSENGTKICYGNAGSPTSQVYVTGSAARMVYGSTQIQADKDGVAINDDTTISGDATISGDITAGSGSAHVKTTGSGAKLYYGSANSPTTQVYVSSSQAALVASGGSVTVGTDGIHFDGDIYGLNVSANVPNDLSVSTLTTSSWIDCAGIIYGDNDNRQLNLNASDGPILQYNSNWKYQVVGTGHRFYVGSSSTANYWINDKGGNLASDKRLKHDIVYDVDGSAVDGLKPAHFVYNADDTGAKQAGFIAQDVLEVLPEAVSQDPESGMYGINTVPIIAELVAKVQELEARIAELERR